jgi:S1-C subfamily serine protease
MISERVSACRTSDQYQIIRAVNPRFSSNCRASARIGRNPMRKFVNGTGTLAWIAAVLLVTATVPGVMAQSLDGGQLRSYADVAEKTMPAVVNISTDKLVDNNFQHPFMDDPMFRRFFNMPNDDTHNQQERLEHSLGSGIVISSDGYILTNNHVVENASKIRVTFLGDKEYEAEIIGTDPPTDVALIKIDAENLPIIQIGDSNKLRVGDQVMAIGNPFGVGQTVTMGIVSALGRNIGLMDYSDLIQTDASINPGNSGGPLVDMQGELVGMNAAILSRSGGSQGIGFAIPTAMAMRIVKSLKGPPARRVDHPGQRGYAGGEGGSQGRRHHTERRRQGDQESQHAAQRDQPV